MCGFAGFLTGHGSQSASANEAVIAGMNDAIAHRGPDDSGVWSDAEAGIALGHRRLSILDISAAGHQPMFSVGGRYAIVFNGEIYNHRVLREELELPASSQLSAGGGTARWRGHSDTEVMLESFERWGVEAALRKFNGMFAFALWDRQDRALHLARDRFGEKPLYCGWMGGTFLFGSELKALKAHPAWRGEIDREALALYMRHTYIPAPYSIYRGIHKLRPGHVLSMTRSSLGGKTPESRAYWSAKEMAEAGARDPFSGSDADAIGELDELLRNAVALRMEADVPLGAFLSGGIDSSLVVALMQAQSARPVKTFSIGFREAGYNEAEHAKAVARHLGTEHTELYVTAEEAMTVIPCLPRIYDEPFSDSSQIPTYLVSQMTRRHVTVALSGDGGDELFGGYSRYFWGRDIWRNIGWLPRGARRGVAAGLTALQVRSWDKLFAAVAPLLPRGAQAKLSGDRVHKLAALFAFRTPEEMYRSLVSSWTPASVVLGVSEPPTALTDPALWAHVPDFVQRMMFLDAVSYLPDDILAKVDRASMAVSLEARVPLLDHRVAEFAWRLPPHFKMRGDRGKWILREVLYRYVPRELLERPKMGFGVPIDQWLRGPLREWAENLLDEARLREQGYFNPVPIRKKWQEHLSGQRNWASRLWGVLVFQAWLEER